MFFKFKSLSGLRQFHSHVGEISIAPFHACSMWGECVCGGRGAFVNTCKRGL